MLRYAGRVEYCCHWILIIWDDLSYSLSTDLGGLSEAIKPLLEDL